MSLPMPVPTKKKKYPFIGIRPTHALNKRLRRVAKRLKRGNVSELVRSLAVKGLPALERELGLTATGGKLACAATVH